MSARGILNQGGNLFIVQIPMRDWASWVGGNQLLKYPVFQTWEERIRNRKDLFLGYCSKANPLANNLKSYLIDPGFSILDWATDFRPDRTIMEEVVRAAGCCRCGLFLFTADDPIEGSQTATAIPRDNVVLEAGYFMSARGSSRVVIVREKGTKMPADLGGIIYLSIEDRNHWQETAKVVASSLRHIMTTDAA
jgi:predicted nucleotide-binding protein